MFFNLLNAWRLLFSNWRACCSHMMDFRCGVSQSTLNEMENQLMGFLGNFYYTPSVVGKAWWKNSKTKSEERENFHLFLFHTQRSGTKWGVSIERLSYSRRSPIVTREGGNPSKLRNWSFTMRSDKKLN